MNLEIFLGKQFFSELYRFIYKLRKYFFICHFWYTSSFESTYKKPPSIKVVYFSDVILVSKYHGCKGEAVKLMPSYMTDVVYKTVKVTNHAKYI